MKLWACARPHQPKIPSDFLSEGDQLTRAQLNPCKHGGNWELAGTSQVQCKTSFNLRIREHLKPQLKWNILIFQSFQKPKTWSLICRDLYLFILLPPCFFKTCHIFHLSTPENRQGTLVSSEYSCSHPRQSVMYWHLLWSESQHRFCNPTSRPNPELGSSKLLLTHPLFQTWREQKLKDQKSLIENKPKEYPN